VNATHVRFHTTQKAIEIPHLFRESALNPIQTHPGGLAMTTTTTTNNKLL